MVHVCFLQSHRICCFHLEKCVSLYLEVDMDLSRWNSSMAPCRPFGFYLGRQQPRFQFWDSTVMYVYLLRPEQEISFLLYRDLQCCYHFLNLACDNSFGQFQLCSQLIQSRQSQDFHMVILKPLSSFLPCLYWYWSSWNSLHLFRLYWLQEAWQDLSSPL